VKFEVLTAVLLNVQAFWDMLLCFWVGGDVLKDSGALIMVGKAVQEDWTA
jgi:hypothetical protein